MTKESKKCSKCGEVKGLSFFSPNKTGYLGVRSHCRSCVDTLRCNHYGKKVAPPTPNRMTKKEWQIKRELDKKLKEKLARGKKAEALMRSIAYVKEDTLSSKGFKDLVLRRELQDARDKSCNNYRSSMRRARMLLASPPWLSDKDKRDIREKYNLAKRKERQDSVKYHVDHIIPLMGRGVCGLHVPWNLQVITATDNVKKSNSYSDWD